MKDGAQVRNIAKNVCRFQKGGLRIAGTQGVQKVTNGFCIWRNLPTDCRKAIFGRTRDAWASQG
jgi:hypothetical protein